MTEQRIIRINACTECPHFGTRWHSKEPTYYCEYNVTGEKQEDYGEELNYPDLIPLFCPLEKSLAQESITEANKNEV